MQGLFLQHATGKGVKRGGARLSRQLDRCRFVGAQTDMHVLCFSAKGCSIQRTAMCAQKTYSQNCADIEEFAAMGNYGRQSHHVAGQIVSKYCKAANNGMPEPYLFECPVVVKTSDSVEVVMKKLAVFLPHEWFAWASILEDPSSNLLFGWSSMKDFWDEHVKLKDPRVQKLDKPGKYLPMQVHGDGGSFQKNDSIYVISMRSLLSSANVAHSQLLLAAIPKGCCNKSTDKAWDTMHHVWNVLVWSLTALHAGTFPEVNHLGHAFAPSSRRGQAAGTSLTLTGLKGFLLSLTGDGEWFQNEYKLRGYSFNECCFNCSANKSDIPYNDFRATAKWRSTVIDHADSCPTAHLISQVPGVTGDSFGYDTLHIMEEGVASHIAANCLFDFVVKPGWGGTQDERLKTVFQKILRNYHELAIDSSNRLNRLTMACFCNPKAKWKEFPELSGIKARKIRYLIPCLLEICQEEEATDLPYSKHRMLCVQNLEAVYGCMDSGLMHLPRAMWRTYKTCTDNLLLHYVACTKICMQRGLLQWNTVHKHHLCAHMPDQAKFLNPKYVSTYTGETMVGFMSSLAHAMLNGTAAHLVPEKVCWRYRLSMWLRLNGSDFEDAEEE